MKTKKRRAKSSSPGWPEKDRRKPSVLKCHRFVGISLGGGKSDRTAMTVLEYYVSQKKLVVSRIVDRVKTEGELSSDLKLHESLRQFKNDVEIVALDVPLSLPKCFRCQLKCPGYEVCDEDEIVWMWKQYNQLVENKKNLRLFTPYTRRCAEMYWGEKLEGTWSLGDALGSNQAPLLARGLFLTRRWKYPTIEVLPRLSLIRWATKEKLPKGPIQSYRHSVNGSDAREYILRQLSEKLGIFFYEQDKNLLIDHLVTFDSLLAALTAFWKFQKQCEPRPKGFPKAEGWIEVPQF